MKYILVGNALEGIFEKSTQKLLQHLEIPLEKDILIAPDCLRQGLLYTIHDRQQWVKEWVQLFTQAQQKNLTPIFIEEGNYISSMLALKALKQEDECKNLLEGIEDVNNFGEHIHLSVLLHQNQQQIKSKLQKSWQDFKVTICDSAFCLFRDNIEGSNYRSIQHELLELTGLKIFGKDTHFESVSHIASFNPEVALKEHARVYYDMVDRGIDFIVTFSWNTFQYYEHEALNIKRVAGRDMMEAPLLYLSEVFLLAMGQPVTAHKIPLGML